MKLNENGDFCLLYVEPEDERQQLFEAVGRQKKPVVLMLPLAPGQPRSRLFQRPEDFSDLKHVKRQADVPVIFLTAGSERLAQLAARYGFPAYSSIDAFAETLAHGRRAERPGSERNPPPAMPRRTRTGPLAPGAAQLAMQRSGHLPGSQAGSSWSTSASGPLSAERPGPLPGAGTAPTSPPMDLAFWGASENSTPFVEHATSYATGVAPSPTAPPRNRVSGQLNSDKLSALPVSNQGLPMAHMTEVPPRRSAPLSNEPYTRHPGWGAENVSFEAPTRPIPTYNRQNRGPASGPVTPLPPLESLPTPEDRGGRPRHGFSFVLILLTLLVLCGAGLGSFLIISRALPPPPAVVARPVGQIMFISSGQLNLDTGQGINDEIRFSLNHLGRPAAGKSYYAWLLGDQGQAESRSVLLGTLNVVNGSANMLYAGDAQHSNLLQFTSRFLVTEEGNSVTPIIPSPDTSTWRYYGAIPAIPDPNDAHHYAFLNHLRHLMADEPILDEMELPGGLNNWFARNLEKLVELTSSGRDHLMGMSNAKAARDDVVRTLSFIDGMSFLNRDIPADLNISTLTLDTHQAALGLLNVMGANQNPPSYIDQVDYHLNGLIHAPGSPASVTPIATSILPAMDEVGAQLQSLRSDGKKLLAMTDAQWKQPAAISLLNDMVSLAGNAYTGSTNPATGQFTQGGVWIHQQLQSIASIAISTYIGGGTSPELGPSSSHTSASFGQLLNWWKRQEGF